MIEYSGVIKHIRFYSEDTKFIVATFDTESEDKPILITGNMSYVNPDDKYRISGDYIMHPKYGKQFQIHSYEIILADDKEEIIRYLCSPLFKGIGKVQAGMIVEALGTQALTLIKDDADVLNQVKGMNAIKKQTIIDVLNQQDYDQEVLSFFMGHGISTKNLALIQSVYQEKTLSVLQNNPYQLIDDIDGIGFKTADTLAMKLGIDPLDRNRLLAALLDGLKMSCFQSGSTYSSYEQVEVMFNRFLPGLGEATFEECLNELLEVHKIKQVEDKYYPIDLYESEQIIASTFVKYLDLPKEQYTESEIKDGIDFIQENIGIEYDETQKEAMSLFLKEPAMILTGGPGTGKTTIVQAMISLYTHFNPDQTIALVAPTGRAAKRLSELTGQTACTIHRLLKWDLHTNTFAMNRSNPIDYDLLVIDEFSMVDTLLFARLLEASRKVKKILIIGDDEQLPSVSPGNVLKDLLQSSVVVSIRLNKIYRQLGDSGIVELAHAIRNDCYHPSLFENYKDIHFTICQNYEVIDYVKTIVKKAIEEGYGFQDIQVLIPMYNGVAGIDALNDCLQDLFNPSNTYKDEIRVGKKLFREGDKILQLKNRVEDNVFNGDVGVLVEIMRKDHVEYMSDTIVVDFDGQIVEYTSKDFYTITHAYCMSVHKSQGNEFKIVIMALLSDYYIMMRKNLIYTGITRCKQSLFLLGSHSVFLKGIQNNIDTNRKTTLVEKLQKKEISLADFE